MPKLKYKVQRFLRSVSGTGTDRHRSAPALEALAAPAPTGPDRHRPALTGTDRHWTGLDRS